MKPPIFIIGNPRSGTTLLRLMLTCHKNIVIPPECSFAIWLYNTYENREIPGSESLLQGFVENLLSCTKIETWRMDKEGLLEFLKRRHPASYADMVSSVYEWYGLAQGKSFQRWGDKNNWHLDHIPTIKALFPDVHFIHIVRDGRNVACSYKELNSRKIDSQYAPRLPGRIEDIARQWNKNIETIIRSFTDIGWQGVYEIRLEDLLQNPPSSLRKLCQQIGEEYDPSMLDYHIINRDKQLEPIEFLEWKEKTLNPPDPSGNTKYKTELAKAEIQTFEEIADDQLRHYGYLETSL